MQTIAQQLAAVCTGWRLESLPPEVVARTKDLLLDYLGVWKRGADAESSGAALRAVRALSVQGPATIAGQPKGAGAAWAALANGCAAHATEMDDVTSKSSLHPAVAVWPAAIALAEELGSAPGELLLAAVTGYEVTMHLGNALNPASAYERGFHPTGVAGAFGAAAAAASLLRLDAAGFVNSLGIAGTMASGSLEYLSGGAWTKRLNAGWAAHAGIVAGRLAAEGFTGPATSVDGPFGLLHAYTGEPLPEEATHGLGETFQVLKVSIKPYACCRYNHGLIDCMLQLRPRLPDLATIEEIRLGVLSGGWSLVADPIERKREPANVVDAQFSAPFAAAVTLAHGRAGVAEYTDRMAHDHLLRQLMAKTSCYRDAELDAVYPDHWPAAATIRLSSGEVLEARQPFPLGEPENPVSREALAAKFRELVDAPWADEAIRRVYDLPEGSLAELMALFRD